LRRSKDHRRRAAQGAIPTVPRRQPNRGVGAEDIRAIGGHVDRRLDPDAIGAKFLGVIETCGEHALAAHVDLAAECFPDASIRTGHQEGFHLAGTSLHVEGISATATVETVGGGQAGLADSGTGGQRDWRTSVLCREQRTSGSWAGRAHNHVAVREYRFEQDHRQSVDFVGSKRVLPGAEWLASTYRGSRASAGLPGRVGALFSTEWLD
jgi:hypothetical protein